MNYNTHVQHYFLNNWIVALQNKFSNGLGEGFLLNAAAVIWEDYTV